MQQREGFQKQWRERFEKFANSQDNDAGIAGWSTSGLAARFRHFVRHWKLGTIGEDWLDAGCGAGTYSRHMAEHGAVVMGIDYSIPTLAKAIQRSPDIEAWSAGDVTLLPLKSEYFDGVVCFGVTQALIESQQVSEELVRVVKPGGVIWIDGLNAYCLPHILERLRLHLTRKPHQMRYEIPSQLASALRKAGGQNIKLHWLPILPQRWQRFQWIAETRIVNWLLQNVQY